MKYFAFIATLFFSSILFTSCIEKEEHNDHGSSTVQDAHHHDLPLTADQALQELRAGNQRFLSGKVLHSDYLKQVKATADDQHPHTVILSCLDSRVPPEIIFDQGIGKVFVARVAGNVEDDNVLGSMEYAVQVKHTKLIVVLGHSSCGAVKGAIDNAELGNLTQLLAQIRPAITTDSTNTPSADKTARKNVELTIQDILKKSPVIASAIEKDSVKIIGGFYYLADGKVEFF